MVLVVSVLELRTCKLFADIMNHKSHYKMGKLENASFKNKNLFVDDDDNHCQTTGFKASRRIAMQKRKLKCFI